MNGVELIFDECAKNVFLRLDLETESITHQDILRQLDAAGCAAFLVHQTVIDDAIALHDSSAATLTSPSPDTNNSLQVSPAFFEPVLIAERRDAQVDVRIDESRMSASLVIAAPYGGEPVTREQCLTVLQLANVVFGIDVAAVNALVQLGQTLDYAATAEAVVARGLPAQTGEDSAFKVLVHTLKDRILKPIEKPDGSIDFHDLGEIPVVKNGDALMRRLPAGAGQEGMNVCGESLPPVAGKVIPFTLGQGVQIAANDTEMLVATLDGMPVQSVCGMAVDEVFRTPAVNLKTGNVSFGGSVIVEGDVAMGFSVRADSDVNVLGVVESARMLAGHDIAIPAGVSGNLAVKGASPSAYVSAGNMLCVGFAQFAELHANVGVIAASFLLHCHITSYNWIKVGGEKVGKSKLIGGEARATTLIKVDTLGSPNGTHTLVELKGDFEKLKNNRHSLEGLIRERERQLHELEIIVHKLTTKTNFPHHAEMSKRAVIAKRNLTLDLSRARQELSTLEQAHNKTCAEVRLVVTRKAHPGTEIIFGDHRLVLTEDWGPGTVQYGAEGLLLQRGKINL